MSKQPAKSASAPSAARTNSHVPPRYQVPLHLIPVELHGRPVSTGTLFHQVQQRSGQAGESTRTSPPRGALHFVPGTAPNKPPLQELDFQAMADSSVGGSGLPRPYGRFIGERAGDGKALYERRPTRRAASWHAKVFGMQDPYRPEAALRSRQRNSPSPEDNPSSRGPSQGALQHNRTARAQTALQHNSPSLEDSPSSKGPFPEKREGTAPAQEPPLRQSPSPARPATHQDSSRFWRPVGVRAAAADPLLPDACTSPNPPTSTRRIPLPAATFLATAPPLPTNLRVDCGDGAAREHLFKGQSPPRTRPLPYASSMPVPGAPDSTNFGHSRGSTGSLFLHQAHHQAADASPAGSAIGSEVPGYRRQCGVYFPVNQAAEDIVRSSLGLGPELQRAAEVPHTTEVLDALEKTHHLRAMSPLKSTAPLLSSSHPCYHCHIRPPLPSEQAVPRRFVPWKGR